ncbi:MAG: class I SAM-dependent methyltransferase [Candidatus Solibacter sp.]|nr:class I SAM-dependent methyltransferase [Candidatus Solibacter sp.]
MYIASDRWSNPDGTAIDTPTDAVYPAFIATTRLFLELLPKGTCDNFLDLCAGTGIAALVAAKNGARHACASDITERCSMFAEFNRRLNAIPNVSIATSDLYRNLDRQTFDCIVAHPPYVPTLSPKWIFYSGGEDGEQVTRGIVEGLPLHLRDGGTFCACKPIRLRSAGKWKSRLGASSSSGSVWNPWLTVWW